MSNIKIIFVDVDYTLFDHSIKQFTPSAIEGLKLARKNGVKVVLCSSRPYSSLKYLGAIDKVPIDGYICTNGGIVYLDNKFIYRNVIPNEITKKVIDDGLKNNVLIQYVTDECVYENIEPNQYFFDFKNEWGQPTPKVKPYENEECGSIIIFGEEDIVNKLYAHIPNVYFFKFRENGFDIYKKQYLKSDGINIALNYYGFSKNEAAAFGDDYSDIDMFKAVKYGVAMGNGKDKVKEEAYYITSDIKDDGLYNALKYLEII